MRVLVVEDDQVLVNGLKQYLQQCGYEANVAMTGTEADLILRNEDYELVILDIGLPGMNGLELLRRIRKKPNYVPVLVVTARDALNDRVEGLNSGADDYLIKPFDLSELEARIRAVVRRGQVMEGGKITCGFVVLDVFARRAWLQGADFSLTKREWSILEFLMLRAGKMVSKDQLISRLVDTDEAVSPNAIEVYIHRLRSKLGANSGIKIHTVSGFGYYLESIDKRPR